jgi:hypothetical protein
MKSVWFVSSRCIHGTDHVGLLIEAEKWLVQVDGHAARGVGEPFNTTDATDSAGRRCVVAFLQIVLGKTESDDKSLTRLRMLVTTRTGKGHPEAGDVSYRPIFQDLGVLAEPDYASASESFVSTSLVQLETPLCVFLYVIPLTGIDDCRSQL